MPRIYLAGPITGLSYGDCTDWRDAFSKRLARPDLVKCLSPMRGKDFLLGRKRVGDEEAENAISTAKAIVTRDYNDCTTSDVVLANLLGAAKPSLGTVMEIAWAHAARVPCILVMERDGNPHDHAMIREAAGYRVESLDAAAEVINAFFSYLGPA